MYSTQLTSLFYYYFSPSQFLFEISIPVINFINYKNKKAIAAYLFISCMASKNTIASNIKIFKYLNIYQLGYN